MLTTIAQLTPDGDKADWPFSVGSVDFDLYDCPRGPTVQTIIPASLPAGANMGQAFSTDNKFSALRFTLPFLQRKWGIGDRKTRGMAFFCQCNIDSLDGQPAKRRGPKPDTKPALTRRQEMNRLAQRYVDVLSIQS
jgi:hypothetical protein